MDTIVDLEKLFHRSKERIKVLGEVFTPEAYVENMLDLLAKDKRGFWSDEEIVFFEPCSGHGNIVLAILKRRLEAIYKKAISGGNREAAFYAVANALNTLWAIDIDSKNVENCRTRVLSTIFEFMLEKTGTKNVEALVAKRTEYFIHILAAVRWQISENETLSAISQKSNAKNAAGLTRAGAKWFNINGHKRLNFDQTWVAYFETCEKEKVTPLEFERASRFLNAAMVGRIRGFEEFDFARPIFQSNTPKSLPFKVARNAVQGV